MNESEKERSDERPEWTADVASARARVERNTGPSDLTIATWIFAVVTSIVFLISGDLGGSICVAAVVIFVLLIISSAIDHALRPFTFIIFLLLIFDRAGRWLSRFAKQLEWSEKKRKEDIGRSTR